MKFKDNLIKFIRTYIAEILVILGAFFIVFNTFRLDITLGYYCLGAVLFVGGIFLAKE